MPTSNIYTYTASQIPTAISESIQTGFILSFVHVLVLAALLI